MNDFAADARNLLITMQKEPGDWSARQYAHYTAGKIGMDRAQRLLERLSDDGLVESLESTPRLFRLAALGEQYRDGDR